MSIALFMLGVAVVTGWSSVRDHLPRYRMVRAAKGMRADMMRLRGLAIQTNRETRFRLLESGADCEDLEGWGGSWELAVGNSSNASSSWDLMPEDASQDGRDDQQSEGVVDIGPDGVRAARHVCLMPWSPLSGPSGDNEDAIVFSPRGWVVNPGTDFNSRGYIELEFVNQVAALHGVRDDLSIVISRAGMVRMESSRMDPFPSGAVGTGTSSTLP